MDLVDEQDPPVRRAAELVLRVDQDQAPRACPCLAEGEHAEAQRRELGRAPDGRILFIDEIHTPDSSRYWYASDYAERVQQGEEPRSLDKEYVRRHYAAVGYTGEGTAPPIPDDVRVEAARRYIEAYETVTGRAFVPDTEDPLPRIRRNLGLA